VSESFSVGEIAILQKLECFPEYNGYEVKIIGPLEYRSAWNQLRNENVWQMGYRCELPGYPRKIVVEPYQLRKRRPPQDWSKLCNLTDLPREVTCA
jgi:hypothetical protein